MTTTSAQAPYALTYDPLGNLMCRALVTHAQARRCNAYSIGARILKYAIHNADDPGFCAEVTQAAITDVSLVQCPVNPRCLITHRERESPASAFYTLMNQRVGLIGQLAEVLVTQVVKQQESLPHG